MNVTKLSVSKETALRKLDSFRAIKTHLRTEEDEQMMKIYQSVIGDKPILNLRKAFQETGLNEKCYPKLAIARGNWTNVWFHPRKDADRRWSSNTGSGTFSLSREYHPHHTRSTLVMPRNIFDDNRLRTLSDKYKILRSPVPHVPPEIRPKTQLSNWYILFEANWEEYPIDPFLLRRIGGTMFFIVEEEWELTELEAMIASGLR